MTKAIDNTTTFTPEQLALIVGTAQEQNSAAKALAKAQERAKGAYAGTMEVATQMGADDFDAAMEALFCDIRANKDGIARKVRATKGKKAWQIPAALSSARSVIKGAFEYGITLLDEDGAIRPFGQVRKDLREVKQAESDAERQPCEIARDEIVATLREMADLVQGTDVSVEHEEHLASVQALLDQLAHDWGHEVMADEVEDAPAQAAAA